MMAMDTHPQSNDNDPEWFSAPRRIVLKGIGITGLGGLLSDTVGATNGSSESGNGGDEEFELREATVTDIHTAMRRGTITAEELTQRYLSRISEYDETLNALLHINERALDRARNLDDELEESGFAGPLHGIPVVLKDNYDTSDMPTTAGSETLEGSIPPDDAFLVARLREAGGIMLGKANMHEFAYGWETVSSLGGQTRNPYDTCRVPGGSSGGTAAAIAANLGAIGTGSDTCGSVRVPPAFTNLVGVRPTMGLTSRDGIIPMSETQDIGGPITRTVTDAAIMLDVMVGYDPADSETALAVGNTPIDGDPPVTTWPPDEQRRASASESTESYTDYLDKEGLEGARFGAVSDLFRPSEAEREGPFGTESENVEAVVDVAIEDIEDEGATVIEVDLPLLDIDGFSLTRDVIHYEFKRELNAYLAGLENDEAPDDLTEIINAPDEAVSDDIIEFLKADNTVNVAALDGIGQFDDDDEPDYATELGDETANVALEYLNRLVKRNQFSEAGPESGERPAPGLKQEILAMMADEDLDALLYPTVADLPVEIGEQQADPEDVNDQPLWNVNCSLSASSGLPAVSVPAGFAADPELPVGLEFLGRAFDEGTLLRSAYAYEQATNHRRPPEGFD